MTTAPETLEPTARRRALTRWLAPTGLFTLAAIGILWAVPRPAQACIMIYPPPPECATGGDPSTVIAFLVALVALYAALVTCALLLPARRRPLVLGLLTGALGLVFLVGLATTLAAAGSSPLFY